METNARNFRRPVVTTANAQEEEAHRFVAEAAELGLPPGPLPHRIETNLGNGQEFVMLRYGLDAGYYQQANGCITLTVFND